MSPKNDVEKTAAGTSLGPIDSILAFEVAGQRYGLPVEHVIQIVELVSITQLPAAPKIVVGVINFRGRIIPVVDMRRRLNLPRQPYGLRTPIIISRLNGRATGMIVDRVHDVIDLQPEQTEQSEQIFSQAIRRHTHHLAAVARLEDGLVLILDPATFLFPEEDELLEQALSEE